MTGQGQTRAGIAGVLTAAGVAAVIAVVAVPFWVHPLLGIGVSFIVSARSAAVVAADQMAAQGHFWAYHRAFHWTVRLLFTLIGLLLCADGLIRRFLTPAQHSH